MKKVSILIPLYNAEKYIDETLASCLNQTYTNIEIIIVDDGSTDESLNIAKSYAEKYTNIKVFSQPNSGAPVARNKAFEESSGEYIQYLDADDLLADNKIQIQMDQLLQENDRCCAFGKFSAFHRTLENLSFKKRIIDKDYIDTKQFLIELWENFDEILPHCWLSPRQVIENAGKWNEKLIKHQDGEFFARVAFHADKVIYTPKSIVYYRLDNPNSLAKNVSEKSYVSMFMSYETYLQLMKNDLHNKNVRKSIATVYSLLLYNTYPEYKNLSSKIQDKLDLLGYHKPIIPKQKGFLPLILAKIVGFYNARNLIASTRNMRNIFRSYRKNT